MHLLLYTYTFHRHLILPVADGGSRLGHVMIDPRYGSNFSWACVVVDHHESEGSGVRSLTESTSVNPRLCDRHNHLLIVSGTRFGKPHRRGKDVKFVPRRFSREAAILI